MAKLEIKLDLIERIIKGEAPAIGGLYDIEQLCVAIVANQDILSNKSAAASYLRAELWSRLLKNDPHALDGKLDQKTIDIILETGEFEAKKWNLGFHLDVDSLTHVHSDHTGEISRGVESLLND